MTSSTIIREQSHALAILRLNRPEVFNSFNREMALTLQRHLADCANDDSVRAIMIIGEGKAFCAGQDLKEIVDPEGPELQTILSEHYNPIATALRQIPKPVIAAVNGVAAGAGANMAFCCDVVVASESASFIQAFSKIGLIPDTGGTYFLPRLIGFGKASAIMMLGDKISAVEAEKLGMIYQVLPAIQFELAATTIAMKLAQLPTRGLALTKQALNQSMNNSLSDQLNLEEELQVAASQTYDYNEGVAAFLEKRPPIFKGK